MLYHFATFRDRQVLVRLQGRLPVYVTEFLQYDRMRPEIEQGNSLSPKIATCKQCQSLSIGFDFILLMPLFITLS